MEESKNVELEEMVTPEDIKEVLGLFEQVPPFLLKMAVSRNVNVVKMFETQVEEYKNKLSDEDKIKLRKVIEMPVPELQELLSKAYLNTQMEQFKILSESKAEPFLRSNLQEFKKVFFGS